MVRGPWTDNSWGRGSESSQRDEFRRGLFTNSGWHFIGVGLDTVGHTLRVFSRGQRLSLFLSERTVSGCASFSRSHTGPEPFPRKDLFRDCVNCPNKRGVGVSSGRSVSGES